VRILYESCLCIGVELSVECVNKHEINQTGGLWDVMLFSLLDYEPTHSRENVKSHVQII